MIQPSWQKASQGSEQRGVGGARAAKRWVWRMYQLFDTSSHVFRFAGSAFHDLLHEVGHFSIVQSVFGTALAFRLVARVVHFGECEGVYEARSD